MTIKMTLAVGCALSALTAGYPRPAAAYEHTNEHDWAHRARPAKKFLHGFRLGYVHVNDLDGPLDSKNPAGPSLAERYDIRTPHMFLIGYEFTWRLIGYDWLNVLLVGNFSVSGLEQSRFFPSANGLIGFEFMESFQLGVGLQVMPTQDDPAHMLMAAGWTPRVGAFYVPVHFLFVPDINNHHRIGATVGVNW